MSHRANHSSPANTPPGAEPRAERRGPPGNPANVNGSTMRALMGMLLIRGIRLYQLIISPLLGPHCRHLPTCSHYAIEAIQRHGPIAGSWLAFRRLLRCHPWGTSGYDPVPLTWRPNAPRKKED